MTYIPAAQYTQAGTNEYQQKARIPLILYTKGYAEGQQDYLEPKEVFGWYPTWLKRWHDKWTDPPPTHEWRYQSR